ncbi:MAG: peptidoglycan-binding protein [Lachnoclostridium sp.]|jgi:5-hydroxyisourate hydrolase-like protein (transthyretin family)|nr:peptidoglycan-binding protein [Lachnoclostridium sp.]
MSSVYSSKAPSSLSTAVFGRFRTHVISKQNGYPIENAAIEITNADCPDHPVEKITTDCNGQTDTVELSTPPKEYSMEPCEHRPYSEYNLHVKADGYHPVTIHFAQILANETAIQELALTPLDKTEPETCYDIPKHVLYGEYPPKIAEDEVKHSPAFDEKEHIRMVIPETIVVHNGPPTDSSAKNYKISYRDYIKSAASCGIYATWPDAALEANILTIMSLTLNRIYTEWYRNKGYHFTITGSGAYDQKWSPHMTVYERISLITDSIFSNFLSRPNVTQPIFTQYSDGLKTNNSSWISRWGSKSLAEDGQPALQILKKYYGDSIYINSTSEISGSPSLWPGSTLYEGANSDKIRQVQLWLNVVSDIYNEIPKITADGTFGEKTKEAVLLFQKIFHLPQTGSIDFRAWYKISSAYVAMNRTAGLLL